MINFNFIKNFYLKESEKLDWLKKPKIAVQKDNDNHYTWFPDGHAHQETMYNGYHYPFVPQFLVFLTNLIFHSLLSKNSL